MAQKALLDVAQANQAIQATTAPGEPGAVVRLTKSYGCFLLKL